MTTQESALGAKSKSTSSILTTGFALFSMFFGAGNLIFPLIIGQSVGNNIWYAIFGLGITAVVVPFIGLGAMVLFGANTKDFFNRLGSVPGFLVFLLLQMILGPFGVIPRLVVLMHAVAKPYIFNASLLTFSAIIALVVFSVSSKRDRLISMLGAVLTPILLLSLLALCIIGIYSGSSFSPEIPSQSESFIKGLVGGYNTMDLIAAFLFATVILPHFQSSLGKASNGTVQKSILKKIFGSSLIAAFLLFLTYVGLGIVSAYHGWALIQHCQPEELLRGIAHQLLGPVGGAIASIAIITACLTTAITLCAIFADYLSQDISKGKLNKQTSLLVTLIITAVFANLGFKGIASFLGPILEITYPSLIVLSVLNLLNKLIGFKYVKIPVLITFIGSIVFYFVN